MSIEWLIFNARKDDCLPHQGLSVRNRLGANTDTSREKIDMLTEFSSFHLGLSHNRRDEAEKSLLVDGISLFPNE